MLLAERHRQFKHICNLLVLDICGEPRTLWKKPSFRSCIMRPRGTGSQSLWNTLEAIFRIKDNLTWTTFSLFCLELGTSTYITSKLTKSAINSACCYCLPPKGQTLGKLNQITFKSELVKLLTQVRMVLFRLKKALIWFSLRDFATN